jgi:hypothetical protein
MAKEDFVFVSHEGETGRNRELAIKLLKANEDLGYPVEDVRTRSNGYDVHKDVAKAAAKDDSEVEPEAHLQLHPESDGFAPQAHMTAEEYLDQGVETPAGVELGAGTGEEGRTNTPEGEQIQNENGDVATGDGDLPHTEGKAPADTAPDGTETGEIKSEQTGEQTGEQTAAVEYPKGNASGSDWLTFAKTQNGYDEATDAELGRDELKAKFGPKAE